MPHALPVQACVFDAFGTLFNVHTPALALEAELGDQAPAFSALWRAKQLEYTWLRSLMGRYADFAQVTADALDYTLAAYRIETPALREKLLSLYPNLIAYADAKSSIERLKQAGLRTGILSNGTPAMVSEAVAAADMHGLFDYVLSVDTVETFKPSPAVYSLATQALGLEAEVIAFVSGNGWDCAGAAAFGFQVVHVNRAGAPEERLGVAPRVHVKDLSTVIDTVLTWR